MIPVPFVENVSTTSPITGKLTSSAFVLGSVGVRAIVEPNVEAYHWFTFANGNSSSNLIFNHFFGVSKVTELVCKIKLHNIKKTIAPIAFLNICILLVFSDLSLFDVILEFVDKNPCLSSSEGKSGITLLD